MSENAHQEGAPGGSEELGEYLEELRKARHLIQAQLTSQLHIQRAKLIAFERGDLLPTLAELTRVKEVLGLSDSQWVKLTQLYLDAAKTFLLPDPAGRVQERRFIEDLRAPNLTFAGIDLHTILLPALLWNADRQTHRYCDDPEEQGRADGRWISLEWTDATLREDLLSQLIRQIKARLDRFRGGKVGLGERERQALDNVYDRLTREGSNNYPRPVAPPAIEEMNESGQVLRILLGQGKYGISLVAERDLQLPAALALRSRYVLHSLAIRVAYVWERDGERWLEFHQRAAGANATWEDAWDTGAAGYVDPIRHKDPYNKTRVSPWQAGADELNKELGIPTFELPHRDNYYFLGVARDQPTGHVILLGHCQASFAPDPARKPMALVKAYDRCRLDPEAVADFIVSKRRWVPSAILLLILVLEAFGFAKAEIEQAFTRLEGQIDLRAFPDLGI
jgi:transcriptional regulator with XRE-family HTH domain